jgi:hypothetical protein
MAGLWEVPSWNANYFIASEHSRGKSVSNIHRAHNRQSGSHLLTA